MIIGIREGNLSGSYGQSWVGWLKAMIEVATRLEDAATGPAFEGEVRRSYERLEEMAKAVDVASGD